MLRIALRFLVANLIFNTTIANIILEPDDNIINNNNQHAHSPS